MCKCFFPSLVLVLFALSDLTAQNAYDQAEYLQAQACYDEAITEYLRFLYFHPGDSAESGVYEKIGRCYLALGNWSKAEKYIRGSLEKAEAGVEKRARSFFLVELLLSGGRYTEVFYLLEEFELDALSSEENAKRIFLQGVTAVYLRQWDNARGFFEKYFSMTDSYTPEVERRVLELLRFAVQTHYKDPQAARVLSHIIPGSGQIYAGDVVQGINSLLVTGAAGTLVVWALAEQKWLDAIVALYFVFLRFYFGSPFHAERIAFEYNENKKNAIAEAVFELLVK